MKVLILFLLTYTKINVDTFQKGVFFIVFLVHIGRTFWILNSITFLYEESHYMFTVRMLISNAIIDVYTLACFTDNKPLFLACPSCKKQIFPTPSVHFFLTFVREGEGVCIFGSSRVI